MRSTSQNSQTAGALRAASVSVGVVVVEAPERGVHVLLVPGDGRFDERFDRRFGWRFDGTRGVHVLLVSGESKQPHKSKPKLDPG